INDSRVLDSISQQDIRIPANGRGDVALRTRIGYQNIRSMWNEVVDIIRGQRARYELRGNAYYDTPVGRLKFPVTVYSTR
ncbi:MAG: LEA type 2 family protein, partial [Thermoanaerobaculia bacterium]